MLSFFYIVLLHHQKFLSAEDSRADPRGSFALRSLSGWHDLLLHRGGV